MIEDLQQDMHTWSRIFSVIPPLLDRVSWWNVLRWNHGLPACRWNKAQQSRNYEALSIAVPKRTGQIIPWCAGVIRTYRNVNVSLVFIIAQWLLILDQENPDSNPVLPCQTMNSALPQFCFLSFPCCEYSPV